MDILYILIPLGMVFLLVAILAFLWAIKTGQFEDLEGPAHRILMDDDDPRIPKYGDKEKGDSLKDED